MGRRKGTKGQEGLIAVAVVVGAVVWVISLVPVEIWYGLGVLLVLAFVGWVAQKFKKASPPTAPSQAPAAAPAVQSKAEQPWPFATAPLASSSKHRSPRHVDEDVPVSVGPAPAQHASRQEYSLPAPPKRGKQAATWIPAGESVTVAGVEIPGGMVYVGRKLPTPHVGTDPCLIDPSLQVARSGDYTERKFSYWPNYANLEPDARRAYLNWLAGGRSDPNADIGYVFLFFYGLERRAIVDTAADPALKKAEWPGIANELRRLLEIYGAKSDSFNGYGSRLLEWVSLAEKEDRLYEQPVPPFAKGYELPFYVRLALGQTARDSAPVPGHLALAWVRLGPEFQLRTAATRCPLEFDRLFLQNYEAIHGAGLILGKNKTKLKLAYRPASAGFRGYNELSLTVEETPDVTVIKGPIKKLTEVIEKASAQLDPFSRALGKNPGTGDSLEAFVYLPLVAWPEKSRSTLEAMRTRIATGTVSVEYEKLLGYFGFKGTLTKEKAALFAGALESGGIGIEPDLLAGAKPPKPDDKVVLFGCESSDAAGRTKGAYVMAALTLQLASAVAAADGDFSSDEASHLRRAIQSWNHLPPAQTRRLLAHLELLRIAPASLTTLAKKLEPLEPAVKQTLAGFMATVAQADGNVSPSEVKMLERIYKALGIEAKQVFSDVHAAATGAIPANATPASPSSKQPATTGFTLDKERIAALQRDTERVSSLLANIFVEAPPELAAAPAVHAVEAEPAKPADEPAGLVGLDDAHATLARTLLTRSKWSRADLQDIADDLDLMLDGALERLNEAAFDTHDMPFFEGEDPVTINAEFLEKVHA